MSNQKKRREAEAAAATVRLQQQQITRRWFIAGSTLTISSIAALLTYHFANQEEKLPVQKGPINIGAKEQIIPKKYSEQQSITLGINDDEKEKILPFLFAVFNGKGDLAENFFTKSSQEAFNAVLKLDPSAKKYGKAFFEAFPDKFTMSDNVKRAVLKKFTQMNASVKRLTNDQTSEMIGILIKHGADPLVIVRENNPSPEIIKTIIDMMPQRDDPAHLPLLYTLLNRRDEPDGWHSIAYAIEKGVPVNKLPDPQLPNLGTALHIIIANENFDDAVRLIKIMGDRYDPNLKDEEGKTALIVAAKTMGTKVVQALIAQYGNKLDTNGEKKLNLDAQDNEGRTAFHYACAFGLADMAESLIKAGADRTIKDHEGKTAEDLLKLTPPQIRQMLASIEISVDRDSGATWNAVITSDFTPFSDKDGKAILATKENIVAHDIEFRAAIRRHSDERGGTERVEKDLEILNRQKAAMTGISIGKKILAGRNAIKALLKILPAVHSPLRSGEVEKPGKRLEPSPN